MLGSAFRSRPETEPEVLDRAASDALVDGRLADAFALADRRCRSGRGVRAHHYVLRAAILHKLGRPEDAEGDLDAALSIDPDDVLANRTVLRSGAAAARSRAARRLLALESDLDRLAAPAALLAGEGARCLGMLRADAEAVEGWLAWAGDGPCRVRVVWDGGVHEAGVAVDPRDPRQVLLGRAGRVRIPWPARARWLALEAVDRPGHLDGAFQIRPSTPALVEPGARASVREPPGEVCVIVPVFADHEATALCFDMLLADRPTRVRRRILVVDDASPDPRITALVDRLAAAGAIELLRNPRNLGFALGVNRALSESGRADVLLLNADTLPPPGFLDRLIAAAYSAPDIATVTPLSNNGETTSYPRPFADNRLARAEEVLRIDRAAAQTLAGKTADLPNGVGFCLYITRHALDRVGLLPMEFGRGYYEDVAFCLEAMRLGLRSVAALDVFVGHAGTRSFKDEKRGLVVRNLAALSARFPGYEASSAAFYRADTLAGARARLDARLLQEAPRSNLVIRGDTTPPVLTRLLRRAFDRERVLVAEADEQAGQVRLVVEDAGGAPPQGLVWTRPASEAALLARDLRAWPVDSIALIEPGRIATPVLEAVLESGRPFDVLSLDGTLGCRRLCGEEASTCGRCGGACPAPRSASLSDADHRGRLLVRVLADAGAVIAGDDDLAALLDGGDEIGVLASPLPSAMDLPGFDPALAARVLAVVPGEKDAETLRSLRVLADVFRRERSPMRLLVLGATVDDWSLLAKDNVFVTGELDEHSLARHLAVQRPAGLLFTARRWGWFDPRRRDCARAGWPTAAFAFGALTIEAPHLGLPLRASPVEAARAVRLWADGLHARGTL